MTESIDVKEIVARVNIDMKEVGRDDRLHLTVVEEISMIDILEIIHQETKGEQTEQDQESDHYRLWMKEQDK